MCDSNMDFQLNEYCSGKLLFKGNGEITVQGTINGMNSYETVIFWAANPPDYLTSFTGSGLPFPDHVVAYQNTPNKGSVRIVGHRFEFNLHFPNSYYAGLGTVHQKPHVNLQFVRGKHVSPVLRVEIGNGVPFRTLTYDQNRKSVFFYHTKDALPLRNQEQILRDSTYPCKNSMPVNFWGLKPPST
jgi:hypothetical protein